MPSRSYPRIAAKGASRVARHNSREDDAPTQVAHFQISLNCAISISLFQQPAHGRRLKPPRSDSSSFVPNQRSGRCPLRRRTPREGCLRHRVRVGLARQLDGTPVGLQNNHSAVRARRGLPQLPLGASCQVRFQSWWGVPRADACRRVIAHQQRMATLTDSVALDSTLSYFGAALQQVRQHSCLAISGHPWAVLLDHAPRAEGHPAGAGRVHPAERHFASLKPY